MDDSTWSIVMTISISVYVLAVAANRGWLSYAADLAKTIARRVARRG